MGAEKRAARLINQYERCKITKEELRRLLERGVLGYVKGIVGPFVLRYQNGKFVVSERAIVYDKSMTEASVNGRKNFSEKVRFAQFLYNIKEIKQIWSKADIEGTRAWNKIIKYNNIKGNHPTTNNIILPEKHQLGTGVVCTLKENYEIDIQSDEQTLHEEDKLFIILVPYDPVQRSDNDYDIMRVEGNHLSPEQISICSKYRKYILYAAVIKTNGKDWSDTTAVEGSFINKVSENNESLVLSWLLLVQRYLPKSDLQELTFVKKREIYQLRL